MKRFSEFSKEEAALEGAKLKIEELINREIIVLSYRLGKSKYKDSGGTYLTIQFKLSPTDDPKVIFTGSDVLADQCQKYEDEMPFVATIKKINKYYTFA